MRPPGSPPREDSARLDSDDERGDIGENFCQPPLLLPLAREVDEPLSAVELDRSNPRLVLEFELPLRDSSRPLPIELRFDELPIDALPFDDRPLAELPLKDRPAVVPRAEKKCWFCDTFRVVEPAAARPLADNPSRLGLGSLPLLKFVCCSSE